MIPNGNGGFIGVSSETKPAAAGSGAKFTEIDTQTDYLYNGSAWINMGNISGTNIKEYGSIIRTGPWVAIASLSGGTTLGSGTCFAMTIRNASGNNLMSVGGVSGLSPFSGAGLLLFGGESYEARVSNINQVRLFAYTSGQFASFTALDT